MFIDILGPGGKTIRIEGTRVVVLDDHGNALLVAVNNDRGSVLAAHGNDPEFADLLLASGVPYAPPKFAQIDPNPATRMPARRF